MRRQLAWVLLATVTRGGRLISRTQLSLRAERLDGADDLVAEHARRVLDRDLAVEQVQVRATDAARVNTQQQLARAREGASSSTARNGSPTCSKIIARIC